MDPITAPDDITVVIASIEMHRQEMEKESGPAAACNEALRKLHEFLDQERKALQLHESGTRHSSNIEAASAEIARVRSLAGPTTQGATSQSPRPGHHQVSLQSAARTFPRNKARRTMGRGER
jgi:hypothetical protein